MTSLQRRAHDTHVPRTVERIIAPSIRHLHQRILDTFTTQLTRIQKICRAELPSPRLLPIIHVHDDDLRRPVLHTALDDGEADAAGAEDSDGGPGFDRGRHDRGAVAGRDAAAKQAGAIHGRLGGDGDDGDVGDDGELGEGGGAHEVEEVFAFAAEARGAVRHHAPALGCADFAAEVGFAG